MRMKIKLTIPSYAKLSKSSVRMDFFRNNIPHFQKGSYTICGEAIQLYCDLTGQKVTHTVEVQVSTVNPRKKGWKVAKLINLKGEDNFEYSRIVFCNHVFAILECQYDFFIQNNVKKIWIKITPK